MKLEDIQAGDWVRFYQNNRLVIGRVEYITKENSYYAAAVKTDIGAVNINGVMEVRKATGENNAD